MSSQAFAKCKDRSRRSTRGHPNYCQCPFSSSMAAEAVAAWIFFSQKGYFGTGLSKKESVIQQNVGQYDYPLEKLSELTLFSLNLMPIDLRA